MVTLKQPPRTQNNTFFKIYIQDYSCQKAKNFFLRNKKVIYEKPHSPFFGPPGII